MTNLKTDRNQLRKGKLACVLVVLAIALGFIGGKFMMGSGHGREATDSTRMNIALGWCFSVLSLIVFPTGVFFGIMSVIETLLAGRKTTRLPTLRSQLGEPRSVRSEEETPKLRNER